MKPAPKAAPKAVPKAAPKAVPKAAPKAVARTAAARRKSAPAAPPAAEWELRLYVAGQTPRSLAAMENLRQLCEEHLKGRYRIEVVDLLVHPQLSRDDEILAVPTLVRRLPPPLKKIIGDLSNAERALVGLQLRPEPRKQP